MTNFFKSCFTKQNLFYTIIFLISMCVIITNRALTGFESILWIADIGSVCGILYTIFMAKHSVLGFVFNIFSTAVMIVTGLIQHIWLNSAVCILISIPNMIYGLIKWIKNKNRGNEDANLKTMKKSHQAVWWIVTLIASGVFTVILYFLGGNLFYLDSCFSATCMVGVILSSRMYLEQYYFFIPANILGVIMYTILSIQNINNLPYVITNVIFTIVSFMGLFNWIKLNKQKTLKQENDISEINTENEQTEIN